MEGQLKLLWLILSHFSFDTVFTEYTVVIGPAEWPNEERLATQPLSLWFI